MNTLEFNITNESRLTCKLSLKNNKTRHLKTKKSILFLKELENELNCTNCNITYKNNTVSIVCDDNTTIFLNNFNKLKLFLSDLTPDLINVIEEELYDDSKKKIIKVKKAVIKSNIAMSLIISSLFINGISIADSMDLNSVNNTSSFESHAEFSDKLYDSYQTSEDIIIEDEEHLEVSVNDLVVDTTEVEIPKCLANTPENEDVIVKPVSSVRTDNYSIDINCEDKSTNEEILDLQSQYIDIANEVGTKWGISPNLLLGMMTQESHCQGNNLMQIQSYSFIDELMEVYNFNECRYVKYVITNNPSKYNSDVTTISPSELNNNFTNISVAGIIYRYVMETYGQNNPIASIEIYNKGTGNFTQSVKYAGISYNDIATNLDDTSYLNYSYVSGEGDPNYVSNILQYVNGDITISMLDENNELYYINYSINKTKEKELTK